MSRGQENQVVNEAQSQNATNAANAQTSFTNAQTDIGNYEDQLSKFVASNPYTAGGEYQTTQNQQLSNTADAAAQAAGQTLQSQAVRTGQNAGGAIAATEATEQANERNLAGQEAQANQQRIGSQAQYNQTALNASEVPAQLEAGLLSTELGGANSELNTQQNAAQTPSFMDELGNGLIQAGAGFASGYGAGMGKSGCWIAAKLFGGWDDPRTVLLRAWIFGPFSRTWYGFVPAWLYKCFGKMIAEKWMPRSPLLTGLLHRLFTVALRHAEEWGCVHYEYRIMVDQMHCLKVEVR